MRILFTGGTGFIGRNAIPILSCCHEIIAPSRNDLNLLDPKAVSAFLIDHSIDVVIHSANPNPANGTGDEPGNLYSDSVQMFSSFYENRGLVKRIIHLSSGAIYNKACDIHLATEEQAFDSMPRDDYGRAKRAILRMTEGNIYGFILFGCYGPSDAGSKFITHCIRCRLRDEPITIRQDCWFDYLHVFDLAHILAWAVDHEMQHNVYNICSGTPVLLSAIAQEVNHQMGPASIEFLRGGLNLEYTGSNRRLRAEYDRPFITLEEGIARQISWERAHSKV